MEDTEQDNATFRQEGGTLWIEQARNIFTTTATRTMPPTSLELVDTLFIDDAANGLADSIAIHCSSLKKLSVVECNLMDEQLGVLIRAILQCLRRDPNSFSLVDLDVSFNKGRDTVVDGLSQILQISKLKTLTMGFQAFGEGRRIDLTPIFMSLGDTRHLKELDIGGNGIRDDDMPLLVNGLVENKSIQVLDLSQNRFTNIGLELLARNLIGMMSLVYLLLEDIRDMNEESISILSDTILPSNNYRIHTIEVSTDLMESNIVWENLLYRLDRNWSGMYEFQDEYGEINIPSPLWPKFIERICHPHRYGMTTRVPDARSILFHLIRTALSSIEAFQLYTS